MGIGMHNIKSAKGSRSSRKRVGRGLGSTGTYSGRGGKGQTARSGVSGLRRLGLKRTILAQPKMRGFTSLERKAEVVNIAALAAHFSAPAKGGSASGGDGTVLVTIAAMKEAGVVRPNAKHVKILGGGELKAALTIIGCTVSEVAKQKIEAAGGKIA